MTDEHKVVLLASCSHFITHSFMTIFPAVMVVIAGENSMSFMDIGIIANIGYFLYGLGSFPAGWLADRFGSKRVLTVGVIGMALSSLLVGMSQGLMWFAFSYAFLGMFASIHHPAGLSLIARRVTVNKGKALGIHGVMGNVGLFLTPLFAASCIWLFNSWRSAYIIYGIIGLGFALFLYKARIPEEVDFSFRQTFKRPKGHKAAKGEKAGAGDGFVLIPISLLVLFLVSTLSGFIFRGSLTFFPALFRQEVHFITNNDHPVVMAGYLTTAVLSMGLIGAWFGGYINDKLKKPELFPAFIFLCVAPLLYFISQNSNTPLIVYAALFSLIYYAWQPAQNYLIAKYTRKASHGMGFGVNFFLIFGLGSVATSSGGYVTDNYGVDVFYWIMSFVAAAGLLAALMVYFSRRLSLRVACRLVKN
ncbi:MFS transporter [Desulfobacterota bacterium M19]